MNDSGQRLQAFPASLLQPSSLVLFYAGRGMGLTGAVLVIRSILPPIDGMRWAVDSASFAKVTLNMGSGEMLDQKKI